MNSQVHALWVWASKDVKLSKQKVLRKFIVYSTNNYRAQKVRYHIFELVKDCFPTLHRNSQFSLVKLDPLKIYNQAVQRSPDMNHSLF